MRVYRSRNTYLDRGKRSERSRKFLSLRRCQSISDADHRRRTESIPAGPLSVEAGESGLMVASFCLAVHVGRKSTNKMRWDHSVLLSTMNTRIGTLRWVVSFSPNDTREVISTSMRIVRPEGRTYAHFAFDRQCSHAYCQLLVHLLLCLASLAILP